MSASQVMEHRLAEKTATKDTQWERRIAAKRRKRRQKVSGLRFLCLFAAVSLYSILQTPQCSFSRAVLHSRRNPFHRQGDCVPQAAGLSQPSRLLAGLGQGFEQVLAVRIIDE